MPICPCYVMLCYVMLCYMPMLCNVMLCYAEVVMLCYAMLCYPFTNKEMGAKQFGLHLISLFN